MPAASFDADRYVDAAAPAVGIELKPDERRAVALQLERVHAHARLVLDLELLPEDELAARFEP